MKTTCFEVVWQEKGWDPETEIWPTKAGACASAEALSRLPTVLHRRVEVYRWTDCGRYHVCTFSRGKLRKKKSLLKRKPKAVA